MISSIVRPLGSSPLARGLRRRRRSRPASVGIIPARAGFTHQVSQVSANVQDHPRSRGVYQASQIPSIVKEGSSPLARGLRPWFSAVSFALGIIPARAGFTTIAMSSTEITADHPRSRGVYRFQSRPPSFVEGSSPLARGLHLPGVGDERGQGIIPARAGFTGHPTGPWG